MTAQTLVAAGLHALAPPGTPSPLHFRAGRLTGQTTGGTPMPRLTRDRRAAARPRRALAGGRAHGSPAVVGDDAGRDRVAVVLPEVAVHGGLALQADGQPRPRVDVAAVHRVGDRVELGVVAVRPRVELEAGEVVLSAALGSGHDRSLSIRSGLLGTGGGVGRGGHAAPPVICSCRSRSASYRPSPILAVADRASNLAGCSSRMTIRPDAA